MEVTTLRERLGREFAVTVELDPPKGPDLAVILQQAQALRGRVAAINIADSPMARMRMSPIALASLLRERAGIDTIFHLTCRDRNLIGLQSELLGAWALGVENILALTGDPPSRGDHPTATGVFDVDAVGLARLADNFNRGVDAAGNKLNGRTNFFIGVAVNPLAADLDREVERLRLKIGAGAAFIQTQPIYDPAAIEPFIERTAALGIPCLAGVLPIKSHGMLRHLQENVPGISVPEEVRRKIMDAPAERVREVSVEIAANIVRGLAGRTAGAHLMPVGDYSMVTEILDRV